MGKFALLADLGVVTVPEEHRLTSFRRKNRSLFWHCDPAITDDNFRSPTCILKPGDRLQVQAFKQVGLVATTVEERLEFCRRQQGNVFVGAQGIPLVFEQKCDRLPKGFWYAFLDTRERLWKDTGGCHGVPNLVVLRRGIFDLDLTCFERGLDEGDAFIVFRTG